MPECRSEPEPPSTSSVPIGKVPSASPEIHWHILFEPESESESESGTEVESAPEGVTNWFVEHCCRATLVQQGQLDLAGVSDLELSVQLLDTEAMRELNLQYRHKNSPTNVLSFASEMPLMVADTGVARDAVGGGLLILGDLVLCPDIIAREATEQSKIPLQHWAHMLVHGTLHLCGYDHEDVQEAQAMEELEILVLSGLGIPDPYAVSNVVNEQ